MARQIAPRVNAMIAPTLPYGITGSMEAYPGAFQITESAYRPFVKQILEGLAKNGFTQHHHPQRPRRAADGRAQLGRGRGRDRAQGAHARRQLVVVRLGRDQRGLRRGRRPRRLERDRVRAGHRPQRSSTPSVTRTTSPPPTPQRAHGRPRPSRPPSASTNRGRATRSSTRRRPTNTSTRSPTRSPRSSTTSCASGTWRDCEGSRQ